MARTTTFTAAPATTGSTAAPVDDGILGDDGVIIDQPQRPDRTAERRHRRDRGVRRSSIPIRSPSGSQRRRRAAEGGAAHGADGRRQRRDLRRPRRRLHPRRRRRRRASPAPRPCRFYSEAPVLDTEPARSTDSTTTQFRLQRQRPVGGDPGSSSSTSTPTSWTRRPARRSTWTGSREVRRWPKICCSGQRETT